MIISQVIEKYHKNRIISIQKMPNGIERDLAIGALVADLGKRAITGVANAIGSCFRKVKKCFLLFSEPQQLSLFEFRGRKKVEENYPEIKNKLRILSKIMNIQILILSLKLFL